MRAAVCTRPGELVLEERLPPPPPPPGWVTLDVAQVGICGTDYHIFEGKHPFLEYPRVIGHEVSGRVAALGEGVSLPLGQLMIVNPYISCGHCVACRKGRPNCCQAIGVLGVHRDGAMADRVAVPAGNLYPAGALSARDAAMVEFLAIGAHGVRRAGRAAGERALVVGAGPIGLGTAIFARIAGLDVTLLDVSVERLTFAHDALGFTRSVPLGNHADDALRRMTGNDGFDVVFDCTGNAASIEACFTRVAHAGTLVLLSVVSDTISFPDPEFHKRETTLLASRNATDADFRHVIASIAAGHVPTDRLATHSVALADLPERMPSWVHDKRGLIKALVEIAP